jgi:hypothetical protein
MGRSIPEKTLGMASPLTALETFQGQVQSLINETQNVMAGWMSRCQEAMTAGVRSFEGLYASEDPAAFASAYGEWLRKSMTLMAEQVHGAQEDALRCAAIAQQFVSTAFPSALELGGPKSYPGAEASRARSAAD